MKKIFSSLFSLSHKNKQGFSIAGALVIAALLVTSALFFSGSVFGQGTGQNNNGNGNGNGGAIRPPGGPGNPICLTACNVGNQPGDCNGVCVPSGIANCLQCQGAVIPPGQNGCTFDQTFCNSTNSCINEGVVCPPPTGGGPSFNFTISNDRLVGQPLAVGQGSSGNVTITLGLIGSPTQPVTLTAEIVAKIGGGSFAQTDVGRVFSQSTCSPNCTSTMTVTGNVIGNYVIRITGTYGAIRHTTDAYVFVQAPPPADCSPDAAPAKPLCGFAWGATNEGPLSENGVGWLSFNSSDCDPDADGMTNTDILGCPDVAKPAGQFKVTVSDDGTLRGCAWSPNIGWVKFNNLSNFPSYAGNSQRDARLASGSGAAGQTTTLEGWARACAGTTNGDCTSMNDRTDGWDGWISLKNASLTNGTVTFSSGVFGGNAWGSEVVGWLGFNSGNASAVRLCSIQLFDFSLTGPTTITVAQGASVTAGSPLVVTKIGTAVAEAVTLTRAVVVQPTAGTLSATLGTYSGTPNPSFTSSFSVSANPQVPIGTYTVRVTGTAGSVVHTKDITVNVVAGAPATDLTLTCVPPGNNPLTYEYNVFVNKPVTFYVKAESGTPLSEDTPTRPFYFTTNGTDPIVGTSPSTSANPLLGITKTFTTIGLKDLTIKVIDSGDPQAATGECLVKVRVKVNPDINER